MLQIWQKVGEQKWDLLQAQGFEGWAATRQNFQARAI
jgi:hypothetical protein